MRVWSRGLGRVELGFDLKKVKIEFVDNQLMLSGKTEPPVSWDFVIKMDVSEVWLLATIAMSKPAASLLSKYLEYKVIKKKMLKERFVEAKKTRTGVQPQVKTPAPQKVEAVQNVIPAQSE